ncbi:MAG: outer membrane efflux protein TolC [Candidatus Desulfovibrio kirbyi]|jgi:outer membrane protein|uniref:Outer membrane efflux protein TolC n=1 Tax=Candidatus Desulfovibrio kirbyi TaxID=2696086 RepID=A0A6L2R4F6_9BACT|nr:TolC family protein [Desulfovibrio sp.]GFH62446.1 MAG: outer membrane efflux protein TolC [Candidatus Desulfovibrio kirbyi]
MYASLFCRVFLVCLPVIAGFLVICSFAEALAAPASGKKSPSPLYTKERPVLNQNAPDNPSGTLTMSEAVRRALQYNPGLGAQESQSRSSEEGRKAARGSFGPKLGMSYTATRQDQNVTPTPTTPEPTRRFAYNWGVEISQSIFKGFALLATYQKAALQADSDKAALYNAELDMTKQVQHFFLEYLRAEENTRSERDSLARLRDQLKITQAFFDVGLRPRLDVLQAEVDVSQAESLLIQAENTRDTNLAMLNTLLGLPATTNTAYTGRLAYIPFSLTLEQCLETAYRNRADLYIAAKSVEIASKDQSKAQSGYYPQVDAYYNVTQSGNTADLQHSGEFGSRTATGEIGLRATWDIFQWGTTFYADRQAGWLVTKMRHEEENLKLTVGYDVKSKLLSVREAEKRIAVADKGLEQAMEAYKVALARYQEQAGTNFDVLDASSKLTAAQASLISAKADYLSALSQIYTAMGEFRPDLK